MKSCELVRNIRDADAASSAPPALTSTSSTAETRLRSSTYWATSIATDPAAASANTRAGDADSGHRSGRQNPSAANTIRLPPTCTGTADGSRLSRSRTGTRLSRDGATGSGHIVMTSHGTVPTTAPASASAYRLALRLARIGLAVQTGASA